MNNWFKQNGIHLAVIGIFLAICFFYFSPAFQGKTLGQRDVTGAQSTQKEINDYRAKDTTILWTNQIFGGMPAYQIWAPYPDNITSHIVTLLVHAFPNPLYTVFLLLFGTYFLFCVLNLNPWLAAAGAVAFTFSSYNIILLAAGHSNQAFAIAFFAPILASMILTFRGKYWLGASLTTLFLAMEIRANHIQMTYYLLLIILIWVGIELYHAIKNKTTATFIKSIVYIGGATLLALAINASLLWSTYEYGKDSTRGQSNLTQHTSEPSNGLSKQYAYEYSQTFGENLTFLVPNAYGGETGLSSMDIPNSDFYKELVSGLGSLGVPQDQYDNAINQIAGTGLFNTYWGDKPLTSGPHYFGAVICFLFIFGLFIVRSRIKWWLLASVILTMFLSIGSSFPYVSDFFFNYFPLYNKFRSIESILAVTGLCVPMLAVLAIRETTVITDKSLLVKKLLYTLYITGGLSLLLWVYPQLLLSFKPSNQLLYTNQLTQMFKGNSTVATGIMNGLARDRESLERADALRSLIFIIVTFGVLWLFIKQKINATVLSILFFAIILVDLWQIDRRYLRDESFEEREETTAPKPREVDTFIQRDTDPDFRVVDLTQGLRMAKQDMVTPFFHKSIWGYSAARMKRFDELIDNQFSNSVNHDVLDMLNTKYIIATDPKTNNLSMQRNETACGHAWFVKSVKFVKDADQEMQAITAFAPKEEAIVDQSFKSKLADASGFDPNGSIKLVKYSPDDMVYESGSTVPSVAVFSEIYYDKGWKMYIDGKEAPYFRADYLLRAAQLPVGNHKVEFIFHPASYYTGEKISLAGSILLILALGGAAYTGYRKKQEGAKKAA
jgi:hypothetical protein